MHAALRAHGPAALEEALLSEVAPVVRTDRLAVGLPHLPFAFAFAFGPASAADRGCGCVADSSGAGGLSGCARKRRCVVHACSASWLPHCGGGGGGVRH